MGKKQGCNQARILRRIRRANTKKIVDKIVNNVSKVGTNKRRRNYLKNKQKNVIERESPPPPRKLKFGSINVDGMDEETNVAIKNLIISRGFDVS